MNRRVILQKLLLRAVKTWQRRSDFSFGNHERKQALKCVTAPTRGPACARGPPTERSPPPRAALCQAGLLTHRLSLVRCGSPCSGLCLRSRLLSAPSRAWARMSAARMHAAAGNLSAPRNMVKSPSLAHHVWPHLQTGSLQMWFQGGHAGLRWDLIQCSSEKTEMRTETHT